MSTQSVKMMHEEENEYYRIANETIPGHDTFQEWNDMMIKKAHLFQLLYGEDISEFHILNAETWNNHPSNEVLSLS
jgi:hypothetical protein